MLAQGSSRLLKWYVLASTVLVVLLLASAGVFDEFFDWLSPVINDLLHDLNHQ
jgi:hypothetical protein